MAVTAQDGRFRAYVCGDDATRATYTQWFDGTLSDGAGSAKGGELVLELKQRSATKVVGTIERAGTRVSFELRTPEGAGGFWAAKGELCATGLIALDDGRVQGAYCSAPLVRSQVVPVRPPAEGDENLAVYLGAGRSQEWLKRVSLNGQ